MEDLELSFVWISKEGTNTIPYLYEMCIASWQVMNPEYKTIIYVSNPNITFNFLSKDTTEVRIIDDKTLNRAYEIVKDNPLDNMKFAHICDYIRYDILSMRKSITLDCDMICIKPLKPLIDDCINNGYYIIECAEDSNGRIGNAFMTRLDDSCEPFYNDILFMYETCYINTSYTFNSIKYPTLLRNRYREITKLLDWRHGFFYPNWSGKDLELLQIPECKLEGYGVHLYANNLEWINIRNMLTWNMWTDNLDWWILKHINFVIDRYIKLMHNAEYRTLDEREGIYKSLKDTKGEDYIRRISK